MKYRFLEISHVCKYLLVFALLTAVFGCGDNSGESLLDSGLKLLSENRPEDAVSVLLKASEKLPDSASVYCNLGIAYWQTQELELALEALQKGAELSSSSAQPFEFLGHVFTEKGEWISALEAFEHAMDLSGRNERVLTAVSVVKLHTGDLIEARRILSEALKLNPTYTPALYNMAILYRDRANNNREAEKYFRRFLDAAVDPLRMGPPVKEAYLREAEDFLDLSEPDDEPDDEPEIVESDVPESDVEKDPETSADPPESGVVEQPEPKTDPVKKLLEEAENAIEKEEFVVAKRKITQAQERDPGNPDPLWLLAVLYDKHLGYTEKAESLYREFKKRFPNDRRAKLIITPSADKPEPKKQTIPDKSPERAERTAEDVALAKDLFDKAYEAQQAEDWDAAIAGYGRAYELDDRLDNALYNIGLAYKKKGDLDSAKSYFVKSTGKQPEELKSRYMLAIVHYELKEYKQAISSAEKALEIDPSFGRAHFLLGLVHSMQNRPDLARKSFASCIESAPGDVLAAKAREHLKELR